MNDMKFIVELDIIQLRKLLYSYGPRFEDMNMFEKCNLGRYIGGFVEKWEWNEEMIEQLNGNILYSLINYLHFYRYEF